MDGAALVVALRPSVPCLRFSQNGKPVETTSVHVGPNMMEYGIM